MLLRLQENWDTQEKKKSSMKGPGVGGRREEAARVGGERGEGERGEGKGWK